MLSITVSVAAGAQPAPPEPLPFVDQSGWIRGELRYSAVVARLGEPPVADVKTERFEQGSRRGGDLTLAYPALGLTFVVEREHRSTVDPIVNSMRVSAPWLATSGRDTPPAAPVRGEVAPPPRWIVAGTGLQLGMAARELAEVLARHHRIQYDFRGVTGDGYLSLEDTSWNGRRNVSVGIDNGRVSAVTFPATDRSRWGNLPKIIGPLVMIALALVAGTLWQRARNRMHEAVAVESTQQRAGLPRPASGWAMAGRGFDTVQRNGQRIRLVTGVLCLVASAGLVWLSWSIFRASSDPYSRLAGLIVGISGASAIVFALAIFSGLRGSLLGKTSRIILIVGLSAYVLSKVAGAL